MYKMQRLEVSGAVRPLYGSLGVKGLTFWRRNYFLILAHPVYKMWIIQEPNMLELWNKVHFEEKKTEMASQRAKRQPFGAGIIF
jgi:hypothetical protein